MLKPLVVVTGKNGQLGWELQQLTGQYADFDFRFIDSDELDLGDASAIERFVAEIQPTFLINCAAYTQVDKAETDRETAYLINAQAPAAIARACALCDAVLIQVSTDYVFNGNGTAPYPADAATQPVNYYGFTKAEGERLACLYNPRTIVVRTAWLYSSHGNNFVKTMLRLMNEREEIKVVNDQTGSPTYAADLAGALLQMVVAVHGGASHQTIYQFSNTGITTWFDFAQAIQILSGLNCRVLAQPSSAYPTPAKRPAYSVMDTSAIFQDFHLTPQPWRNSLETCLHKIGVVPNPS